MALEGICSSNLDWTLVRMGLRSPAGFLLTLIGLKPVKIVVVRHLGDTFFQFFNTPGLCGSSKNMNVRNVRE